MKECIRSVFAVSILGLSVFALAATKEPISQFLDAGGRLDLAESYQGSLDPVGYRMVTSANQAPIFVAEASPIPKVSDTGQWGTFGGIREGCNGPILAIARLPNGNLAVAGNFSVCTNTLANNIAIYSPSGNVWASLGNGSGNGLNDGVKALAVSGLAVSGSDLYVGGNFTQAAT